MSSCNVVIIPVDGSKNSERAVDCEYFLNFNIMWCTLHQCARGVHGKSNFSRHHRLFIHSSVHGFVNIVD